MTNAVERMMKEYLGERKSYPLFTAEKQIELINFLYENGIEIIIFPDRDKMTAIVRKYEDCIFSPIGWGYNFTHKFANLLRNLKPHIDNAKVKGILEG